MVRAHGLEAGWVGLDSGETGRVLQRVSGAQRLVGHGALVGAALAVVLYELVGCICFIVVRQQCTAGAGVAVAVGAVALVARRRGALDSQRSRLPITE